MSKKIAVIGGGPAGIRAAEVAQNNGAQVTLFDAKRSVGRKFLVAGKSGLNLTNDSPMEMLTDNFYGEDVAEGFWKKCLAGFDSDSVRAWARALGIETFVATAGKVFPVGKKSAPLLRRWVHALRKSGVEFQMNHNWVGLEKGERITLTFENLNETVSCEFDSVILAMGGGSWPNTGSTGWWTGTLKSLGIGVGELQSANCGWECEWSKEMLEVAEGKPLHNLDILAGEEKASGELMVTRYGFEGAPIYKLGRSLRAMESPEIIIDFKSVFTREHMIHKMESARRDFFKEAHLRWKLPLAACALIKQLYGEFDSAETLVDVVKACKIPLIKPRPLPEAISTAGGVLWGELDDSLMVKKIPGVYCAGEMIDWEAPTGGYLIQGCLATGTLAGKSASQ